MLEDVAGVVALRKLRKQWQEDAGTDYPDAALTELLVLYDVCHCLEFSIFQAQDVLGPVAWQTVQQHLDTYIAPAAPANAHRMVQEAVNLLH